MLKILSYLYSFGAYTRRGLYNTVLKPKKLPVPVISIGNLSVGGTGKTPLTVAVAKELQKEGFKVCVLSRGYKRKSKGSLVVGDGEKTVVSWEEAGDEPFLIAKEGIPVVVSNSRYEGGLLAIKKLNPSVFILDDGFQHFQLHRDINILVVDALKPFWEDKPLPLGRLREPPNFYRYADIIVLNRLNRLNLENREKVISYLKKLGKPFFVSQEKVEGITNFKESYPFSYLTDKRVGIFSGLGNNRQFFQMVEKLSKEHSFSIVKKLPFPDHFDYKDTKLPNNVDIWLTTKKDLIKLKNTKNIFAVDYQLTLNADFFEKIKGKIKTAR
ncbi:MAG: tetraacyldisaccharide 4'-kinase [Aquificae bacterium]|nr:tetraacyldisaccharide 4'-kinase [Aquificota bacterium]